jgi:hypothetical protein
MPPTGSLGLPWCWHPRVSCLLHGGLSPLRRSWWRVTVQGMSENPAGGARMPPGLKDGFPMAGMSAGCMEIPGDPGPGDGRQPRIIQRGRPLERRGGQSCAVSVAGAQEGAAARRVRIPIPPSR